MSNQEIITVEHPNLTTYPTTRSQKNYAMIMSVFLMFISLLVIPFANVKTDDVPGFVPAVITSVICFDFITAVILLNQFRVNRTPSVLVLSLGYLFSSLTATACILTFPKVFSETGLLHAGSQTGIWLYSIWHGGFGFFICVYLIVDSIYKETRWSPKQVRIGSIVMIVSTFVVSILITYATTHYKDWLPILVIKGEFTSFFLYKTGLVITLLNLVAVLGLLIKARGRTIINLWLTVAVLASLLDVVLSVYSGKRYTYGWYMGKLNSFVSANVLIVVLILEFNRLYFKMTEWYRHLVERKELVEAKESAEMVSQALLKEKEKMRQYLNGVDVIIVVLDAKDTIEMVNQKAETLLGYQSHEVIGKKWREHTAGDLVDEMMASDFSLSEFLSKSVTNRVKTTIVTKQGDTRCIEWSNTILTNVSGEVTGVICAGMDITERNQAEDALRHYREHLEELVEQRTIELESKNALLEEAKDAAETANRAKSEFLANMSHEIRTPISAVIGLNYLIQKSDLTYQQKDYVEKSISAAKSLMNIINDILDISKIEAQKVELEYIDFDLYEVLNNISNIIGYKAYDKGLKLHFSINPEVPQMLKGDPLRLNQVLLNLTNNAVKFTNKGGVNVSIDMLFKDDKKVMLRIAVKDTGIGMTEQEQSQLFRVFSQADMSTTRKYGGTGLGLVISKSLVELMGGTIQVESTVDVGSCFSFIVSHDYSTSTSINRGRIASTKFLRLMLVCEDYEMKHILTKQLEQFDFVLSSVDNAMQAIELLAANNEYDIILIDEKLSDMSGLQLSEKIKRDFSNFVQTTALISSFDNSKSQARSDHGPTDYFLDYPISQSRLYDQIMTMVQYPLRAKSINEIESGQASNFTMLRGASILVVEDNEINQLVAKEFLNDAGMHVDLANNGEEALNCVISKPYDAILMDLQMPVMDGYEATTKIRELAHGKDTPIIAMTADALKGVNDQVLEAGMNAYITKPFDPTILLGTLQRFIQISRARDDMQAQAAVTLEPSIHILDLDVEDAIKRLGRNTVLYRQILLAFKNQHAGDINEVREALDVGDWKKASMLSHTLKSVAANIGAYPLAEAAEILQETMQKNQAIVNEQLIRNLDTRMSLTLSAITQYLDLG